MKNFKRFLIRCLLAVSPYFFVFGLPITLLSKNGIGGALPTLIFGGAAVFLSGFLVKKYNNRCNEEDSRAIKSYTEVNKE